MSEQFCPACGAPCSDQDYRCSECGTIQESFTYTSKTAAAVLAFFGGNFGLHRFYLGKWWGVFYLLFFWTYIPALVGFIESIVFATTDQRKWNDKYNHGIYAGREKGGFVLVLVFVVGFLVMLGIFAAIALPAYQDYTVRAKMSEPIAEAAVLKEIVAEYVAVNEEWPENLAITGAAYSPQSSFVTSFGIKNGVIYLEIDPSIGAEGMIILVPAYDNGSISWSCDESTLPEKYLPAACR